MTYYKTEVRGMTYKECWNFTRSPVALVLWFHKLFRLPMSLSSGYEHLESPRELDVAEEGIPEDFRRKLDEATAKFRALEFEQPRYIGKVTALASTAVYGVSMLHKSGEIIAKAFIGRSINGQLTLENVPTSFLSRLQDGTDFSTTDQRETFEPKPGAVVQRLVGKPAAELFRAHCQWLEKQRASRPPEAIRTPEEYVARLDELELAGQRWFLERGCWVPMTPEEIAAAQRAHNRPAPPPLPGQTSPAPLPILDENAKIYAELEKLVQPKKKSWTTALVILAVSLALFVALGVWQWDVEWLGMLIVVLLIHEAGHFVAMKVFKYEDVTMFFIPLFGAAVSGRSLRVEGWKKAIVSLMGPLPGILLGTVLAIASIATGNQLLDKFAMMLLLVNGFNLLPLLPLDGGWVLSAVLFCRNRWADTIFRVLAGLTLCFMGGTIFLFLGIMMIFTATHTFKISTVAANLRKRGYTGDPPDQPGISNEATEIILQELKTVMPSKDKLGAKALATMVHSVYENVHTKPPGVGASIILLGAYAFSIVVAILFTGAIFANRNETKADEKEIEELISRAFTNAPAASTNGLEKAEP